MINENLHRKPVALDTVAHRTTRLRLPITDWTVAKRLNAVFVAAAEFSDVCREFPIVFVKAGKEPDGSDAIAPLALLGMVQQQNLYLSGERWRAQYMPALLRAYPFCIARLDGGERFAVCIDTDFAGVDSGGDGHRLFEDDGQPAPLLKTMTAELEKIEGETQRTRLVGKRLLELGLLQDMRYDATLPDGSRHSVDGFFTIDDKKATALPDAVVGELHRSGVLGLMHLHWASLGNMQRLLDWHVERSAATAPVAPAPVPAQVAAAASAPRAVD